MHMFLSFLTTVIQNFSCQVWWQSHIGSSCSRLKIIPCLLPEVPVMTKNIRIIFFFFFCLNHYLNTTTMFFLTNIPFPIVPSVLVMINAGQDSSNTTNHAQQCFQGEKGEETSATRLCILRGTVISNAEPSIVPRRLKELHIWRFRGSTKKRSS